MAIFKYKIIIMLLLLISTGVFLYYENNAVIISRYIIENSKIPHHFKGFKIVHLSDLHGKVFKDNNTEIINIIKKEKPDIIAITGDLIDRRRYDEDKSLLLIRSIKDIAPIYFVTGNHEAWSGKFNSLEDKLKNEGVMVLRNTHNIIKKENEQIALLGIDDPSWGVNSYGEKNKVRDITKNNLHKAVPAENRNFTILLAHRPNLFKLYTDEGIDLSLTGHAHGGQIIIPFIGGILAPDQGVFPQYYRGQHKMNGSIMIVSRGLGNSLFPQRLFNRPEIISIELK